MTPRRLFVTADGRLDRAPLLDDPRLRRALAVLDGDGEETRLVGGAVRNALLGLPPGDVDLATTASPETVLERARRARIRAIPTGIAHGTVTLVSGGLPLEVTTLREDIETDGRHAVVRFGRDFARDAERRDFTMNALSAGRDGRLHDTTGGAADLAAGRVRFIGEAATRIREDYLRILRFFRFHAIYGVGPPDPEGLAASVEAAEGLDRLSRERIRSEMLKLLSAPGAAGALATMEGAGLLRRILDGSADVARAARLAALDARGEPDPVLTLGALAARTAGDVERLRERLRLSNAERDRLLAALAASASVDLAPARSGGRAPGGEICRRLLFDHGRAAGLDALRLAAAERQGGEGWAEALELAAGIDIPEPPVSGRDLMARGLKGPAIGVALAAYRAAYRDAGFPDDGATRTALLDGVVRAALSRQPRS